MTASEPDLRPYAIAAVVACVALPLLVLGLATPLWLAVTVAALTLAAGAIAARAPAQRPAAHATPLQSATSDARAALARLDAARRDIRDRDVRATLDAIARSAHAIVDGLAADAGALGAVQRALTYYLPRAGALAASYAVLEARGDGARRAAVKRVLEKLAGALAWYADRFADDALHALDIELKLVDAALEEDLGGRR